MSSSRPLTLERIGLLVLAGISGVGVILAITPEIHDAAARLALGITAGAVLTAVFLRDRHLLNRHLAVQARRTRERVAELLRLLSQPDFSMEVRGATQLPAALLFLAIGVLPLFMDPAKRSFLRDLIMFLCLPMGALGLLAGMREFGKPVLKVSQKGLWTPHVGLIPWQAVRGIHLQRHYMRGREAFHFLAVHVPTLGDFQHQFGAYFRTLFMLHGRRNRGSMRVLLRATSESPDLIETVAKKLWTANTGRADLWFPGMSKDMMVANEELATFEREYVRNPEKMLELMSDPIRSAETMQRLERGSQAIKDGLQRTTRPLKVAEIAGIVAAGLAAAFALLKLLD